MAYYKADHQDLFFNLFDVLKIQDHDYGLEAADMKGIIQECDKFVENEIFPTREPSDVEGVKLENGQVKVASVLRKPLGAYYENGWYALGLPEDIGGTPVPEALTIACSSLATSANVGFLMYPGLTKGAMNVIRFKGTEAQKNTFLAPIMEGKWGGTMCLTEAGAGSDVGSLRTTAKPLGNGKYAISGTKIFISSGDNDLYENLVHLVLARTPTGGAGTKGISLFIVPKYRVNADGSKGAANDVICSKVEHKMGIHSSATCELQFGANGQCEGELIGEEFDGMATMFIMMNEARLLCGLQGEAQANLAYQMALKYAKERAQFGKEIINHADVRRQLLKMRALARGMRSLCLYTANLFDLEKKDHNYAGVIGLLTPICKAYCSEKGFEVAVEAVQVHGGYGYCTEYGVEQFVRDTKIATIYEGTNAIQAMDFVTRKILKDGGKSLGFLTEHIMKTLGETPETLAKEKGIFLKTLGGAKEVLGKFEELAKSGQGEKILQYCTDFLDYCSGLVVGWRLLESAVVAQKKLASASGDEKIYLETKVVDLQVYVQLVMMRNLGYVHAIKDSTVDYSKVQL